MVDQSSFLKKKKSPGSNYTDPTNFSQQCSIFKQKIDKNWTFLSRMPRCICKNKTDHRNFYTDLLVYISWE